MPGRVEELDKLIARVFGGVLRELRKARNLSQERLAELAGCHRTNISFLERGLQGPTLYLMHQLARVLDVPLTELARRVEIRVAEELQAREQSD